MYSREIKKEMFSGLSEVKCSEVQCNTNAVCVCVFSLNVI